jgi:hypothetical protein
VLVFVAAFVVFLASPMHQMFDSRYSLLVSESLLEGHGLAIERFFPPEVRDAVCSDAPGTDYQVVCFHGHLYHFFPTGGSTLAVPLVALGRAVGWRPIDGNGLWSKPGELRLQRLIAALLMALFAIVVFELAAAVLPTAVATVLLLAMVAGTQVWSTASRGLWSHTWMILLVGVAALELWRADVDGLEPRSGLLATVLTLAFFARPTAVIPIAAIAVYLLLRYRARVWSTFAALVVVGFSLFCVWSLHYYGTPMPPYYAAARLERTYFAEAFAANLISPGRGLLLFLPQLLFLGYLLVRYPPRKHRAIALLAAVVSAGHLVAASGYPHWWGGHSFGPRLLTDMLPWLAVLAVIAVESWLGDRAEGGARDATALRVEATAAALLVGIAVAIHAGGALSIRSELWNNSPREVDVEPSRIWDWSDPQFLAVVTERPWVEMPGN